MSNAPRQQHCTRSRAPGDPLEEEEEEEEEGEEDSRETFKERA